MRENQRIAQDTIVTFIIHIKKKQKNLILI